MSSKNPTIKRIMKEASELANQPSAEYHAAPLESDLFEWHFTLKGPPSPSPFEGGVYHGQIVLPPAYPLKPPSFRFLTPTGRFEVNREICLSISGHHEETWQPAWGIRTALVAIRSFMDTDAKGQLGGMDASEEVRRRLAGQSQASRCGTCGKTNEEIMKEQEENVAAIGGEAAKSEPVVPEELRLGYREDLGKKPQQPGDASESERSGTTDVVNKVNVPTTTETRPASGPAPVSTATAAVVAQQQQQQQPQRQRPPQEPLNEEGIPAWIDKAIYGVAGMLVLIILNKFLL